jgi:hypothetical protein
VISCGVSDSRRGSSTPSAGLLMLRYSTPGAASLRSTAGAARRPFDRAVESSKDSVSRGGSRGSGSYPGCWGKTEAPPWLRGAAAGSLGVRSSPFLPRGPVGGDRVVPPISSGKASRLFRHSTAGECGFGGTNRPFRPRPCKVSLERLAGHARKSEDAVPSAT